MNDFKVWLSWMISMKWWKKNDEWIENIIYIYIYIIIKSSISLDIIDFEYFKKSFDYEDKNSNFFLILIHQFFFLLDS